MLWIKAAALFNIAFGVFHLFFWRLLKWKEQLKRVSPDNRAVIQTMTICLTFLLVLSGILFLIYSDEVQATGIGKFLMLGMALFWLIRTFAQIYFFNLKERVHKILLLLFIVGIALHVIPLL